MAGGGPDIGSYSPLTGFVFIFNLIVGAGALTIPRAFAQVGLVYGSMALATLAITSYVTATFMVEAIAGVNALRRRERQVSATAAGATADITGDSDVEDHDDDDDRMQTEFMPLMVPAQVLTSCLSSSHLFANACAVHVKRSVAHGHQCVCLWMRLALWT